jgi:hypothetical protein
MNPMPEKGEPDDDQELELVVEGKPPAARYHK